MKHELNWPKVGGKLGRWAALDTETTGLSPAHGNRVVEVAVVLVEDGVVTKEYHSRINPGPGCCWNTGASSVNGIYPDDVAEAPGPEVVWPQVLELIVGVPVVAHNASFDQQFVKAECERLGLEPPQRWCCTMQRRIRLGKLYWQLFGKKLHNTHAALADTRAVAAIAPLLGIV
ncbi:3'-5' exonuclease [Trichlorobacter lovleyi]|uniref:3'-5' exonuclease n=1 Tax=Trichlorobacter lovleyi TaxID=313985 RepID=UPI00223F1823|nr:3'-5' exonuclease [Trichlorobacter lovleyi]QOX78370.1 3'-5' exonuclease [Trichlorobacter lovleyi]